MVRLAWCSLGLALLGPTAAHSQAPADATVLVQRQARAQTRDEEEQTQELWTVPGGLPDDSNYAFEHYKVGELVEGRSKDGRWLPCVITGRGGPGNLWNIHVSDEFPGYDLPNVPTQLLRRPLGAEMSDWYVDNSWLHHQGLGVKYRHSKSMHNKSAEYAPWGSLVVGTNEGDGWLRVNDGFLPMEVNGVPVLLKKEREHGKPVELPLAFTRQEETQAAYVKDPTPPPHSYEQAEWVKFRTKAGDWLPAQITAPASLPNTYHVVVRLDDGYTVYPVLNVPITRLMKATVEKHIPKPDESPMCQRDGCILLRVRTEEGKEILLNLSKRMKTGMLIQMACNKRRLEWSECQERSTFKFNGAPLDTSLHIHEAGLTDSDVVEMYTAPKPLVDQFLDPLLPDIKKNLQKPPQSLAENKEGSDLVDELFKGI